MLITQKRPPTAAQLALALHSGMVPANELIAPMPERSHMRIPLGAWPLVLRLRSLRTVASCS